MTHGDGAVFAWVTAQARPALVKGIVAVEPERQRSAMTPPQLARLAASRSRRDGGVSPSTATDRRRQRSRRRMHVEHIRLADRGVRGNGPMVMMEKNNREALQPILDWMQTSINAPATSGPAIVTSGVDPAAIANRPR